MKVLMIGDVFGRVGRMFAAEQIPLLRREYEADFCVVNAENATNGRGLNLEGADELFAAGADCLTMGNHTWSNPDIYSFIDDYPMIRPANFEESLPGKGSMILEGPAGKLGVLNLQGRVYMDPCDNPFSCAMREIARLREETPNILIDFHAEASAEKTALAYYTQGLVSAVIGTHTHVQTADERILDGGTAYMTDVGMTGPTDGVIGMDRKNVVNKFVKSIPTRFEPAKGAPMLNAVLLDIDGESGQTLRIARIFRGK